MVRIWLLKSLPWVTATISPRLTATATLVKLQHLKARKLMGRLIYIYIYIYLLYLGYMQFLGYINIYVNISMNIYIYIYISIPQLLGGVSHVDRNHGQMLYIYLRIYHQKSTIHVGIYIYIYTIHLNPIGWYILISSSLPQNKRLNTFTNIHKMSSKTSRAIYKGYP